LRVAGISASSSFKYSLTKLISLILIKFIFQK
jgi:hypothetical protein